jgi:aminoglycoside 6-adenylyltransferase
MILTSTRALPGGEPDRYSDYDIILALIDVRPFFASREWLTAFGTVLVMYRDPLSTVDGFPQAGNVVQFDDGLKIDFSLWQQEYLQLIAAQPALPDELDAGYRVLLDKDGLTGNLQAPTFQAYYPTPPTREQYLEAIEDSFLVATYVAKYLWRDDRLAARFIFDTFLKDEHLRPMLEWLVELEHNWSVKPGQHGRKFQRWLRPELWAALESTYTGIGYEESWQALENALALLRKAALEVGARLGYTYPAEMDRRTRLYLQKIRKTSLRSEI